jgi:hypothetical protein
MTACARLRFLRGGAEIRVVGLTIQQTTNA